jgi:Flp pilus assembly protein TadD
VATGWAFWGQRDGRVLAAGWYGTNGALWGLWASSLVTDPLGAALLTVAGALLAVWILDRLVFPLGDAPIALPPLSLPFVVVALLASLALPVGRDLVARVAGPLVHEAAAEPPALWRPRVVPTAFAGDLAAAWDAWERADYARARGQFAALAAAAPDLADAHNGHGWALFRLGALTEADAAFRRAVALDARHPYSLDGLGWIAFRRGRYREAARFFREAALGAPAWADPHDGLGWVAYTRGRFREAREHFDRAIALAPHHASALGGLGWTSLFEARVDEARRFFERASAADPGFLVAREGLGWALARSGRPREAERVFASILERSPGEREALTGLADARRRLALRGEGPARAARSEWEAVRRALPPSAAAVSIAAAAVVLLRMPWAGLAGLLCVVAGATLSVLTAGPSALAWLDLHVQTLAPLGLLIGRLTSPSMRALGRVAAAAGAGVAVWALQHAAGMTLPLLAFNGVGLTFLALGTARFTRDGRLSAAE